MNQDAIQSEPQHEHGNVKSYTLGFLLSIVLTLAAYYLVAHSLLSPWTLIFTISGLAILQMVIQLLFFLGNEFKPHWNLLAFLFMAVVILLLVAGSLWIMYSLDHRVMLGVIF